MKGEWRKLCADRMRELNFDRDVSNLKDLSTVDFPIIFKRLLCKVNLHKLINESWKNDGIIPFTRKPARDALEFELRRDEELAKRSALDAAGGSTAPRQVGDMTTRITQPRILIDGAIPVVIPQKNEVNRTALANAYNKVQNNSTLKLEILKKLSAIGEPAEEVISLIEAHFKETDDLRTCVHDFVKTRAGRARTTDLYDIEGGPASEAGIARVELGIENVQNREKADADRRRARELKGKEEYERCCDLWRGFLPDAQAGPVLASCTKTQLQEFVYGATGKKPHQNINKANLLATLEAEITKTSNDDTVATQDLQIFPGRPVVVDAER